MTEEKKGTLVLCPRPGVDLTRSIRGWSQCIRIVKVVAFVDPSLAPVLSLSPCGSCAWGILHSLCQGCLIKLPTDPGHFSPWEFSPVQVQYCIHDTVGFFVILVFYLLLKIEPFLKQYILITVSLSPTHPSSFLPTLLPKFTPFWFSLGGKGGLLRDKIITK